MTLPLETPPMVAPTWLVAFSGHRPRDEAGRRQADLEACRPNLRRCLSELAQQAEEEGGRIELICGPAEGSDQLALSVARELGLAVHVILPLSVSALKGDFADSPSEAWGTVEEAIASAHDYRSDWTVRVASGDGERPACYHDANLRMLELADVLVAIQSSGAVEEVGGTGELLGIVDRAGLALPVIELDPACEGRVVRNDAWSPRGVESEWLTTLNADLASAAAASSETGSQRGGEDPIWDVHRALDNVANNNAQKFRGSLEQSIYLHFSATVLAAVAAALNAQFDGALLLVPKILTSVELLLVIMATVTMWRANRTHANATWRRTRFGAELVDGLVLSAGLLDPIDPPIGRVEDRWKLFAVSVSLAAHRQRDERLARSQTPDPLVGRRDEYLRDRIGVQRGEYFQKNREVSHSWHERLGALSRYASVLAVLVIAGALLVKMFLPPEVAHSVFVEPAILFLPIFLPLLASLASSLTIAKDAARRSNRYNSVIARLDRLAPLIAEARSEASLSRLVGEVENLFLNELFEWHGTAGSMGH